MHYYTIPGLKEKPEIKPVTLADKNPKKFFPPEHVENVLCGYFNVKMKDISEKTRRREVVYMRQVSMYFLRTFTLQSLKTIGQRFGGRDHTTVIHSVNTLNDLMDTDDRIRAEVGLLYTRISGE